MSNLLQVSSSQIYEKTLWQNKGNNFIGKSSEPFFNFCHPVNNYIDIKGVGLHMTERNIQLLTFIYHVHHVIS